MGKSRRQRARARRRGRGYRAAGQRGRGRKVVLFFMAGISVLCVGAFLWTDMVLEPNLEDVSRLRAEALVSRTVNEALAEQLKDKEDKEELFIVEKDEAGRMELVQADSIGINTLLTKLTVNLQESFKHIRHEKLEVPIGALLGSKLLSQTGPHMDLSITPLSVLSTDFRTEFESQGINQTKYKIYIIMKCRVKVMAPFSSRIFDTSNTVLIAETVILGDVPDSYVQVPEEDILDVTPE